MSSRIYQLRETPRHIHTCHVTTLDPVAVDFHPTCNPPVTASRASEAEQLAVAVSGSTDTLFSGSDGSGLQYLN